MNYVHDEVSVRSWPDANDAMNRTFELAARLAEATERGLSELELTVARATVIWQIHQRGPRTQRELSRLLNVTPRNVTGLIDGLESTGFVVREPHPTDRRATLVTLTERGREVGSLRDRGYRGFAERLFGDVPPDELAAFVATLDQVLARLRVESDGSAAGADGRAFDVIPDGECAH